MEDKVLKELRKPLDPKLVRTRPDNKLSYIEGWAVEDIANQIFNFQWNSEVIELIENTTPTKNHNNNQVVSFRAKVRVEAYGVIKEGVGFGSGVSKDIHIAYEKAIKEAETDAEKRALKKFGHRFGLTLYDKKQAEVRDVDLYDVEIAKAASLHSLIESKFNANKKEVEKEWRDNAVNIAFLKRVDKEKYLKLLDLFGEIKQGIINENS